MIQSTTMRYPLTLAPVIERLERDHHAVPVVTIADGRAARTTWGGVAARARRLAAALSALGLRRGDRVATLMTSHARHLEAFLGIPLAGGVLHPLNPRYSLADLEHVVRDAGDRFLLADAALLPVIEPIRDRLPIERVIVSSGEPHDHEAWLDAAPEAWAPPQLSEDEPLVVGYTSGTTGRPKGVAHSHRAILLNALSLAMADGAAMSRRDVVLPVTPFFHAVAGGFPFAAAAVGARLVMLPGSPAPEALLDAMAAEQVTLTIGLATGWLPLLDALERHPGRWKLSPKLRLIGGGNAFPSSAIERFEAQGIEALHAWGMTEVGAIGALSRAAPDQPAAERARQLGRQGRALPFVDARIVDPRGGAEVPRDDASAGELQVRGPWLTGRYLRGHESGDRDTSESFTEDGWFRTGDLAVMDAEGSIRIVDRVKDVIRIEEEWVSSAALEQAIAAHASVQEVAVVSARCSERGEIPLAAVVLRPGALAPEEELRRAIPDQLLPRSVPVRVVFVDAIPRASTGKVSKVEIGRRFGSPLHADSATSAAIRACSSTPSR